MLDGDDQLSEGSQAAAAAVPEDGGVEALEAALAEREALLAASEEANHRLLERLRAALLATDEAIDPALVRGDDAEELEASFAAARELVERIRDAVRRQAPAPVPAGAPGRARIEPRNAFEKIRNGLEGQ